MSRQVEEIYIPAKARVRSEIKTHYDVDKADLIDRFLKRTFDFICAVIILAVASPFMILVAAVVKFESEGPAIFKQERLGLNGRTFMIYKFRSMIVDAEKDGPTWAEKDDTRTTKVGRILRKYRIDELPQLFNIICGEMSFVGPRPEREYFYRKFERYIPDFRSRLIVKPGLTGWAQINGGYDISPEDKLKYDKEYIKNHNFKLDLKILVGTAAVVFKGEGAR